MALLRRALSQPLWLLVAAAVAVSVLDAVALGAATVDADVCGGGQASVLDGVTVCTHGADDPAGLAATPSLLPVDHLLRRASSPLATEGVACIGDGSTGPRVQVIYARAETTPDRFADVLPVLRLTAAASDAAIHISATRAGEGRRVRFVTTEGCQLDVATAQLSQQGDDSFDDMVRELRQQGFDQPGRKYLVFLDAAVGMCGQGHVVPDDSPGAENANNGGVPLYARIDTACWTVNATHELLHMLGAVQHSAPNSSGAGHCTDEADVMCYVDTPDTKTVRSCTAAYVEHVDCNHDDYFDPRPSQGSYLATHWNVADSSFLEAAEPLASPSGTIRAPRLLIRRQRMPVAVELDVAYDRSAALRWWVNDERCVFADARAAVTTLRCRGKSRKVRLGVSATDLAGRSFVLRQRAKVTASLNS